MRNPEQLREGSLADTHLGKYLSEYQLTGIMDDAVQRTDFFVLIGDIIDRYVPEYIQSMIRVINRYTSSGKILFYGFGNHEFYGENKTGKSDEDITELNKRISGETGALCYENQVYYLDECRSVGLTGINGYIGYDLEQEYWRIDSRDDQIQFWHEQSERLYLGPFVRLLEEIEGNENVRHVKIKMHYGPTVLTQGVPDNEPLRGMSPKIPEAILEFAGRNPHMNVDIRHGHWHSLGSFGYGEKKGEMRYMDMHDNHRVIDVRNVALPVLMREGIQYNIDLVPMET